MFQADIQTVEETEEETEIVEEIVIEVIDVMVMAEMTEIEERGIIETEVTEVDMNIGTGTDTTKAEEAGDPMSKMIEETIQGVVEGKMKVSLNLWDTETGDHVGMRMLTLLL